MKNDLILTCYIFVRVSFQFHNPLAEFFECKWRTVYLVESVLHKRPNFFEKRPASLFLGIFCSRKNENKFFGYLPGIMGKLKIFFLGIMGKNLIIFSGICWGIKGKMKMKMKTRTSKQNKL
jgi:hypothetical protein